MTSSAASASMTRVLGSTAPLSALPLPFFRSQNFSTSTPYQSIAGDAISVDFVINGRNPSAPRLSRYSRTNLLRSVKVSEHEADHVSAVEDVGWLRIVVDRAEGVEVYETVLYVTDASVCIEALPCLHEISKIHVIAIGHETNDMSSLVDNHATILTDIGMWIAEQYLARLYIV